MTVVLRNEITGKRIIILQVQKLYEDGNSIRVYYNDKGGRRNMTSYAFASVISVEQEDIWGFDNGQEKQ